jgi:hypothetical protein
MNTKQEETNALAVKELKYQGFEACSIYHEVRVQAWNKNLTDSYEIPISKQHAEYLAKEWTEREEDSRPF